MTDPVIAPLEQASQPIRKSVRRLRWFKKSFHAQVELAASQNSLDLNVDDSKLAVAFIEWMRAFEAQKPDDPRSRPAYVGFAAGLMLRTLITHDPISSLKPPDEQHPENAAHFWPQGYVYVSYCLNVRAAILDKEFGRQTEISPRISEIESWWSFKENVQEDGALSIAFLDLFAGAEPNWIAPQVFVGGDLEDLAPSFFKLRVIDAEPDH